MAKIEICTYCCELIGETRIAEEFCSHECGFNALAALAPQTHWRLFHATLELAEALDVGHSETLARFLSMRFDEDGKKRES